jgi:hypothetical protein
MPQNFLSCDREQVLLMPASLCEWLPKDHLVWLVLSSVEAMDLALFYASYRSDGRTTCRSSTATNKPSQRPERGL